MILDDHKILTQSLKFLLDNSKEISVVGVSNKIEDAVSLYMELEPDVVLMDIHFNDDNYSDKQAEGIQGLMSIKKYNNNAKVMLLTSDTSGKYLEKVMHLADGYIIKERGIEELIEAIKCCHNGMKVFDSSVASKATGYTTENSSTPVDEEKKNVFNLSEKELSIIKLLAEGKTNKEISAVLKTSEGYIRNILTGTYEKLSLTSHKSTTLVAFAAKNGLL